MVRILRNFFGVVTWGPRKEYRAENLNHTCKYSIWFLFFCHKKIVAWTWKHLLGMLSCLTLKHGPWPVKALTFYFMISFPTVTQRNVGTYFYLYGSRQPYPTTENKAVSEIYIFLASILFRSVFYTTEEEK